MATGNLTLHGFSWFSLKSIQHPALTTCCAALFSYVVGQEVLCPELANIVASWARPGFQHHMRWSWRESSEISSGQSLLGRSAISDCFLSEILSLHCLFSP